MRVDLVERAQRGDREAFDVVMLDSIDRLYAIARLTAQDADVAEDAVQEALLKCWRDLPTLRDVSRFDAWLHRLQLNSVTGLTYDSGGQYTYPDRITFSDRLSLYANPVAASATDAAPLAGVGTSAADLASFLEARQDLVATTPKPVSVGGATGFMLEVSLPTGARSSPDRCATEHGEPRCASLFVAADPQANYGFGLVGPESAVVYLLDTPSGNTLLLVIDDVDGVDSAGLANAATPIVESIGGFK